MKIKCRDNEQIINQDTDVNSFQEDEEDVDTDEVVDINSYSNIQSNHTIPKINEVTIDVINNTEMSNSNTSQQLFEWKS